MLYAYHAYSVPRLVFPSIQENSSAIAILPHFLEVCGRKLDSCSSVQDWFFEGLSPLCFSAFEFESQTLSGKSSLEEEVQSYRLFELSDFHTKKISYTYTPSSCEFHRRGLPAFPQVKPPSTNLRTFTLFMNSIFPIDL